MSKITVRADDDLVAELEALDASKSQVVREALRSYLDEADGSSEPLVDDDVIEDADGGSIASDDGTLDDLVRERVDEIVEERVDAVLSSRGFGRRPEAQDVNVTVALEGAVADSSSEMSDDVASLVDASARADDDSADDDSADDDSVADDPADVASGSSCARCGEALGPGHVYCPNCGEKASRRAFCECGDEVRSDWSFCPGCGRRTPAADVLESG